ncbi:MAG: glycosyltransferase family 4 protein [Deltaproteobacteria bacterium]|nr:glycosyltransferase family 4 protein [Deltaproteobacteria bacterium]
MTGRGGLRIVHTVFPRVAPFASVRELGKLHPHLAHLLVALRKHAAHTAWVAPSDRDVSEDDEGISIRLVGAPRNSRRVRALWPWVRAIVAERPDVVHVHGLNSPWALLAISAAADRVGARVIVEDHGSAAPRSELRRRAWRSALARAKAVIFGDRSRGGEWIASGVLRAEQLRTLFTGSSAFTVGSVEDRERSRAATAIRGAPAIGFVGHLDFNKDPITALAGFARFAVGRREARLFLRYGRNDLLEPCRTLVNKTASLSERVHFLGSAPHAEMESFFRAVDVLISTSHREAYGYVAAEALSSGAALALSDLPSHRLLAGPNATYFRPADPEAAAAALEGLVHHLASEDRERRGRWFGEHRSYARVAEQLLGIYG